MTNKFKNAMNKINNARKEFVTGFKSGYKEVTEGPQIKVSAVDGTPVEKPVSNKTGEKLGVVIAMLVKFFRNRTVKMIMKCLGITAALTSAVLNLVFIGTIGNFIFFVLPLVLIALYGVLSILDKNNDGTHIAGYVSSIMVCLWGILNTIVWLSMGNPLMALANVALYIAPLMVWINTAA